MTDTAPAVSDDMTLAERTAMLAKLSAFQTELGNYITEQRTQAHQQMLTEYLGDSGSKTFNARIAGQTVAQFTLKEDTDTYIVTDPDAFAEWVEDHYPDQVKIEVVVLDQFKKNLLKRLKGGEDGAFDPENGEEVPGVKFKKAGDPTSFGTSWKKIGRGDDQVRGQDLAIDAVLNGDLRSLLAVEAITAGGVQ